MNSIEVISNAGKNSTTAAAQSLRTNGYVIFDLSNAQPIHDLARSIERSFPLPFNRFHESNISIEQQVELIKTLTDDLEKTRIVSEIFRLQSSFLAPLLGPDIDIQTRPHLRISRPNKESEMIGWHRDWFYGNTPHEMNVWFPLIPLQENAGLALVHGSHLGPSENIRVQQEADAYKKGVTKGSSANSIGFVYSAKTDDSIERLEMKDVSLLRPHVGQAVLFFGCMIHRALNGSNQTRATIDIRLRQAFAPTNTKPGYYEPLSRGPISSCAQQFLASTQPETAN